MSKSQETIVFLFLEPIGLYLEKYLQFRFSCLLKSVNRANDSLTCEQLKEWVLKDKNSQTLEGRLYVAFESRKGIMRTQG